MVRHLVRSVLTLALLGLLLAAPPALAQSPAERQAAVALGDEALKLFEKGRWSEAYERFQKANEMVHAPPLQLYMARCQRNRGMLVEAHRLYASVAGEPLAAGAPEQFLDAQQEAKAELADLDDRIPKVAIEIAGAPAAAVVVTIDGKPVTAEQLAAPLPLNPGTHAIEASAEGYPLAQTSVDLTDQGGLHEVALVLGGVSQSEPPPAEAKESGPAQPGPWWPGAVALGVGAVGLTIGAITGGIAMSETADIESRCIDGHCPPADQEQGESASTLAAVSTAGFIIGGIAATAGVVLIIWRPGGAAEAPESATRLRLGPGSVRLTGTFW